MDTLLLWILLISAQISLGAAQLRTGLFPGWSLPINQTILSANGSFALGFFTISNRSYIGIWYANVPVKTKIWVANRNSPASSNAELKFSDDGDLKLLEPKGSIVLWSSGTAGKNVSSLILDDLGNFALYAYDSSVVWQSFDHPTDTWVTGMKMYLGYNITAWRASDDPASGRYSMKMLESSEYVSLWNGSVQYWSSGIWSGNTFVNVPELTLGYLYEFAFVNSSESSTGVQYFIWTEKSTNHSSYSHFKIEQDGVIRVKIRDTSNNDAWITIWQQPKDPCTVERICGQFGVCNARYSPSCICPSGFGPTTPDRWNSSDWSQGCVPNKALHCSASCDFVILPKTSYEQTASGMKPVQISEESCKSTCLQECSCVAYLFETIESAGTGQCYLYRKEDLVYNGVTSSSISAFSSYLKITSTAKMPSHSSKLGYVLGLCVGGVLLAAVLLGLVVFSKRQKSSCRKPDYYVPGELQSFSYKDLQSATSNFKNILGDGGFGTVYKGKLADNSFVAVKVLKQRDGGDKTFHSEVSTIGAIQHINLVCLRGFCVENCHRLLVYEYMEKGSLNTFLFSTDNEDTKLLDWSNRFTVAVGTAKALAYLHEECKDCIVHCDIKPENILLDENLCPKVSDFGLARLIGRDFGTIITTMKGTRGYLAPEWISGKPITSKADVYSYGMTLLEIIGGRRNINRVTSDVENIFFPLLAAKEMKADNIAAVVDSRLQGRFDKDQASILLRVAIWCIQDEEAARPSMGSIVKMLDGTVEVQEPEIPKSFMMLEL